MTPSQLTLIIGGARSGKSTYAQRLAEATDGPVLFVATAEAGDGEMASKIARHRAERPAAWHTLEVPRAVAAALAQEPPAPLVLLDCVTLWVSNMLLAEQGWQKAQAELEALLTWHQASQSHLIVVTNEVGLGIVPADALTRTYREWLGHFNQRLAQRAGRVFWMVAGIAVDIKALAPPAL